MSLLNPNSLEIEDWLSILRELNSAIIITDGNGIIKCCNAEYLNVTRFNSLGVTCENIVGLSMYELLEIAGLSEKDSAVILCMQQKKKVAEIFQAPLYKIVMSTAFPIFNEDGSLKLIYAILQDENTIFRLMSRTDGHDYDKIRDRYYRYLNESNDELKKNFIIASDQLKQIAEQCHIIGTSDISVLLLGESGVGKDIIAKLIHSSSERRDKPFFALNCGAISENLIESELFGYAPGSFTGANKAGKVGIFESANSGTIMLDEIGDLPLSTQVKLLRVLENRQVIRVGSVRPIQVDFRLISATNKNLTEKVQNGEFRQDLLYRINAFKITIPPLRERRQDIAALALHYLSLYNLKYKLYKNFQDGVINEFIHYEWPGNIRELKNVVEQAVVLCKKDTIDIDFVRAILHESSEASDENTHVSVKRIMPLKEAVAETEKQLLEMVKQIETSSYKAAKLLGIDQTTVLRKLKKYNINGFH